MHRGILCAIILIIFSLSITITVSTDPADTGLSTGGDASRQCECWNWSLCISNCSSNRILDSLFHAEHNRIAKLPTPFVVVFPYQSREPKQTKQKNTNTMKKDGFYRRGAHFWVHLLNGEHVQLILNLSRVLGNSNEYLIKFYKEDREVISNIFKRCFYIGSVITESTKPEVPHSYVAADTCDGLRGIIVYKGIVYGILPVKHPNMKENDPVAHFIYPETTTPFERNATNLHTFWQIFGVSNGENSNTEDKLIVPVSLVLDHILMKALNLNIENATYFALSLLNMVTKSFMSLKQIQIKMSSLEFWNIQDKSVVSNSIRTTLKEFLKYRLKPAEDSRKSEMKILLSGRQFYEDVEYFSIPGSVCTKRSASVVQVTSVDHVYHVSRLVSLALAEMFGINSFPCPDKYECTTKTVLSKGDEGRLKLVLLSDQIKCLKDKSTVEIIDSCGNGKLDSGEECDSDRLKCCDKATCMVTAYAQCNGGECCSANCTFKARGQYCRPSRDQCDIPEFCSGDNGDCPKDIFFENGQPCNKGSALCYQGRCPTRDAKCRSLWGSSSQDADNKCYSTFNLKHDDACGANKKCSVDNQMCGVLYCQGGSGTLQNTDIFEQSKIPLFNDANLQYNQKNLQCKHLINHPYSYVDDGTECGSGRFCFGKVCNTGMSKITSQCPKDSSLNNSLKAVCYNRGICTNLGVCLCYPGWYGRNCSSSGNDSYFNDELKYSDKIRTYIWAYFKEIGIYNGPLNLLDMDRPSGANATGIFLSLSSIQIIVILGSVIGLMFIALALFLICYRRRNAYRSKGSKNYKCNGANEYEDTMDALYFHSNNSKDKKTMDRKNNFGSSNRKSAEFQLDAGISSGKRRGRRHRRRPSDGGSSGQKHLCRDNGDGNESTGAVSDMGCQEGQDWNRTRTTGTHSDNDINNSSLNGGKIGGDDIASSVEKIIKFGSMPSYKEDKLNRSNNSPLSSNVVGSIFQDGDSGIFARSSDPLLTSVSPPCNNDMHSAIMRSQENSNVSPLPYCSVVSSLFPSTQPIASPEKKESLSFINKHFTAPIGLPAPALFPSVPYSSGNIISVPVSSLGLTEKAVDVVFKQPEKGILKNKSSGDLKETSNKSSKEADPYVKKRHKHKHHKCEKSPNDSNSATSPSSGSQSSLSSCDSDTSYSSSSSSSSGSSGMSSLVTHSHKKHGQNPKQQTKRSQSNTLPNPPTILCNAANQTDDLNSSFSSHNKVDMQKTRQFISTEEEDMDECDEEDCEECMKLKAAGQSTNKSPPETLITSNSSAYDIVGSTDDGYNQYHSNSLRFNPDLSVHYDCHMLPSNQNSGRFSQPLTSEEMSEQNSETEVDSHLQMLLNQTPHFSTGVGLNKMMVPVPFPTPLITKADLSNRIPNQLSQNPYQTYAMMGSDPYYYSPALDTQCGHSQGIHSPPDNDDMASEVSISAYCRVNSMSCTKATTTEEAPKVSSSTSDRYSNIGFDGGSNDGTIEGSDTSSLPDTHCDLLNLAQLGIGPSRPNPMLSQIMRAQNRRSIDNAHSTTNSGISPAVMWTTARTDNRSPHQLPPPNSYPPGNDYLA